MIVIIKREIDMDDPLCNNIRMTIYDNDSIHLSTWKKPIIFKLNKNNQWTASGYYFETEVLEYLIENNYIKPIKEKDFLERTYGISKHTLELNNAVLLQVL